MSIGKRILSLRKREGLSQEQLANILGTTRQAVSKWESEKSMPDIDLAVKIGVYFHVSMDYLLLGQDSSDLQPKENTDLEPLSKIKKQRNHLLIFGVVLFISILLLILLPVFSAMYCNLLRNLGPVYADPTQYLKEWPLAGIKWMGVIGFWFGLGGFMWTIYRLKNK